MTTTVNSALPFILVFQRDLQGRKTALLILHYLATSNLWPQTPNNSLLGVSVNFVLNFTQLIRSVSKALILNHLVDEKCMLNGHQDNLMNLEGKQSKLIIMQ